MVVLRLRDRAKVLPSPQERAVHELGNAIDNTMASRDIGEADTLLVLRKNRHPLQALRFDFRS